MEQTAEVVETVTQATPVPQQGGLTGLILYLIVACLVIYVAIVRPNKKRMAEYQKMLDSLKVGSRVMAAGIYGTVKKINEKTLEVEVAEGVVVEVIKNAVASVE